MYLIATGSAFPSTELTSAALAARLGVTEDWIIDRTGIRARRVSSPESYAQVSGEKVHPESLVGLSVQAARRALEMAELRAANIDGIWVATCTPDRAIPSVSTLVQAQLGAKNAWAIDLNAACSGFLSALLQARGSLLAGLGRNILVIGADLLTRATNWSDASTCILFGDGAGAAILSNSPGPQLSATIEWGLLGSDGAHWDTFRLESMKDTMSMEGRELYRLSVSSMVSGVEMALTQNSLALSDIAWFVPHQANLRILEGVAKRLHLPIERVAINLDRFGNTSAATIPTVLDECVRLGRIQPGQRVILSAFGAGVTWGTALVKIETPRRPEK